MPRSASVFISPPARVHLVNAFEQPYNNAVATARTCYASRIVQPADVDKDAASRQQRDAIAQSTYEAGHHTTLQHATFQFALENVSRQFIWSFLHAHPFYNSEQVSQRYVTVKPECMLIPRLPGRSQALYEATLAAQMRCYQDLVGLLVPSVQAAYFKIFPARGKHGDRYMRVIRKKAQEIARYALPVATFAHLYHTISGLTLHRYHRLSYLLDVPSETRQVVEKMVEAVHMCDPLFFKKIEDPIPLEQTHEFRALMALGSVQTNPCARAFRDDFDAKMGSLSARLVDYSAQAEALLAQAVRTVLGAPVAALDDGAALRRVLSPAENPSMAGALNLQSLGKLSRVLGHVYYVFQKKLSHTADSQEQRHRLIDGSRPILQTHYVGGDPDVVVPPLVAKHPAAYGRFMQTMDETWQAIDTLLNDGIAPEFALYLLPNAFPIRFTASGDLAALRHKWTLRLCFNAQEEIWRSSLDEVRQVAQVHPRIGAALMPPCSLRQEAGLRPLCPEGARYCGVPVWKQPLTQYERVI